MSFAIFCLFPNVYDKDLWTTEHHITMTFKFSIFCLYYNGIFVIIETEENGKCDFSFLFVWFS